MKPVVGIVMGSDSDAPIMNETSRILKEFGVEHEMVIASAHRSPRRTMLYSTSAEKRGLKVLVCGAGRVLHIGEGAVIGAGSVITKSVPPRLYVAPSPTTPLARVNVPLPLAKTMEEFWGGLVPLPGKNQVPPDPAKD